MGSLRVRAKHLAEALIGYDIKRIGSHSIALIARHRRADAWFSYEAQLRWLLDRSRIDLVLDVGANDGQFALQLMRFYNGEILSFEPVSSAFERLAGAAASTPQWHVHNFGLGSQTSRQTIYVARDSVFSSLRRTNDYALQRFRLAQHSRDEVVTIRRLDDVLDELVKDVDQRHLFLKLDTQGYDVEVFNGLGARSQRIFALQSELSLIPLYEGMPHWTEMIAMYEGAGLQVIGMFPVSRDLGRVIEYDCLMIRA
jgi:FkbM family methyltransferase